MGVDDRGEAYALEDDPIKGVLVSCGGKARLGDPRSASAFAELIARKDLMGKDLFAYGDTGKRLQDMVGRMLAGPGSVRKVLQTCLQI